MKLAPKQHKPQTLHTVTSKADRLFISQHWDNACSCIRTTLSSLTKRNMRRLWFKQSLFLLGCHRTNEKKKNWKLIALPHQTDSCQNSRQNRSEWRKIIAIKDAQSVCPNLRMRGHLPAPVVNGGGDGLWKWPNFRLSRARDLDLDLGSGHTAHSYASLVDLYLHINYHWYRKNFLWTIGRTFETHFIRSTRRSRPKHMSQLLLKVLYRDPIKQVVAPEYKHVEKNFSCSSNKKETKWFYN